MIPAGAGASKAGHALDGELMQRVLSCARAARPHEAARLEQSINRLAGFRATGWLDVEGRSSRLTRSGVPWHVLAGLDDREIGLHVDVEVPETSVASRWPATLRAAGVTPDAIPDTPMLRSPARCDIELGLAPDRESLLASAYFTQASASTDIESSLPHDVRSVIEYLPIHAVGMQNVPEAGGVYACVKSPGPTKLASVAKAIGVSQEVGSAADFAVEGVWPSRIGLSIRWSGAARVLRIHLPRIVWMRAPATSIARLGKTFDVPGELAMKLGHDADFEPGPLWICAERDRVGVLACFEPSLP